MSNVSVNAGGRGSSRRAALIAGPGFPDDRLDRFADRALQARAQRLLTARMPMAIARRQVGQVEFGGMQADFASRYQAMA